MVRRPNPGTFQAISKLVKQQVLLLFTTQELYTHTYTHADKTLIDRTVSRVWFVFFFKIVVRILMESRAL